MALLLLFIVPYCKKKKGHAIHAVLNNVNAIRFEMELNNAGYCAEQQRESEPDSW